MPRFTCCCTASGCWQGDIRETLFFSFLEREMAEEAIRKMIERPRTRLPFWDDMIETTRIGSKAARRRRTGVSHHIFCRAGDVFPWEQCGFL
ncbi:hypothetical protein [Geobacillus sp. PA-3]|uniref:hypothetical protein n=1 Tax=Geobacillus sp. PA-3 TaxID=1699078 RepID=UPI001ED9A5D7|nr:hypothetical protein [Geobacillus sp. PA-3]